MADGSHENRTDSKQTNSTTFSAVYQTISDIKKCSDTYSDDTKVKLSFYIEREAIETCENSDSRGVAGGSSGARHSSIPQKCSLLGEDDSDHRKKRCFDRYDSSESSDSGVVVLSPPESSGSCSDIPSPGSSLGSSGSPPGSPLSPQPAGDEAPRMPPWAPEPAPAGPRRTAPVRDRRITEYYNHKMKPNTLKRDNVCANSADDPKRKCLPKNGVHQDLEKYISYLSQTLSPRVLLDMDKQTMNARKTGNSICNGAASNDKKKTIESAKVSHKQTTNGFIEYNNRNHNNKKNTVDPSANGISNFKQNKECLNKKVPKRELVEVRIAPALPVHKESQEKCKVNGIVSSTTKLDSKMNGVTCGSNNLSLTSITPKKESPRKTITSTARRTNRRSSACIANSANITWSKANNLKQQVQLQKQNCVNSPTNSPINNITNDLSSASNGVRPLPLLNGNLGNMNVPVSNLSNCHQINIPVSSTNLASFVAMPHNVMLTTLRIPQNGITAQTVNQHNNLNAFNRPNVGVSSPTKLNGQFVFPLVQNLNGMMQIPSLVAKVAPNFVLPQTSQLTTQRDSLQTQQPQILINGTLLKLTSNTVPANFTNLAKPVSSNLTIPAMNKTVAPGIPSVGMTVQSKSNFTVNISHPLLMPQQGFIVNSVPNINVKETWSNITAGNSAPTQNATPCANSIVHHPPPATTQSNDLSSIPIAPVKPPDLPDQGLDPPYIANEDIIRYKNNKCDIPWLSKTVNNNHVFDPSKYSSRPFAQVCNLSQKLSELTSTTVQLKQVTESIKISTRQEQSNDEIRRVKEVARREETIFTQITVLKDVTSNVKNTVIEANYSNATNESSESGIGTDKSIDSPSDSQTSKECDEDSALSLSVSVCSVEAPECQKSPILKQPTKLRFPPKSSIKADSEPRTSRPEAVTGTVTVCLWENCKSELDNDCDLLEHLQAAHVEPQAGQENYVCLWEQCKVRGKPSCSRLWLERHAMSHGGNKPFKCIVQGCGKRFSTQMLLERHVNNHFNEQSPNGTNAKKSADSASKLIRRNGKKLRYRRQPWSARMFDFFDAGIMEGIAYRLIRGTRWRLGGRCPLQEPRVAPSLVLRATIRAARYDHAAATTEALVTYYPPHVLEDEWVPEKEVQRIKIVEIARLPVQTKVILYEQFCSSYKSPPLASPVPTPKAPAPIAPVFATPRVLPVRTCTSSRLLNKLINKQKEARQTKFECKGPPLVFKEYVKTQVSGAAKRKLGRRYGGNAFWPCGR